MDFPFDTRKTLIFIHWLFDVRKVASSTVNSYLSGLRYLHLTKGIDAPALRPPIIEQMLKGKNNLENIEKRLIGKPNRAPVTLTVMKLLKLKNESMGKLQGEQSTSMDCVHHSLCRMS